MSKGQEICRTTVTAKRAYSEKFENGRWKYLKTEDITHTSYIGEAFSVPPEDRTILYECLTKDHQLGNITYYNERRKKKKPVDPFPLYMDLDFFLRNAVTVADIQDILDTIQAVTIQLFPTAKTHHCIIASSDSKPINGHKGALLPTFEEYIFPDGEIIKTGFHLIWPDIIVNVVRALHHRKTVVNELVECFPDYFYDHLKFKVLADWDKHVVDISVIENGSLRMLGQSKAHSCKKCRNIPKARQNCLQCQGKGCIHEGRAYLVVGLLSGTDEELKRLQSDFYYALTRTSVWLEPLWSDMELTAWTGPAEALNREAELMDEWLRSNSGNKTSTLKRNFTIVTAQPESGAKKWQMVLMEDPEIKRQMENFLVVKFSGPPGSPPPSIKKFLIRGDENGSIWWIVCGSKYCRNKRGHHGSSDVYYERRFNYLSQRCYSTKCPSDYYSPPVIMPDELVAMVTNWYRTKAGKPPIPPSKKFRPTVAEQVQLKQDHAIPRDNPEFPPIINAFLTELNQQKKTATTTAAAAKPKANVKPPLLAPPRDPFL